MPPQDWTAKLRPWMCGDYATFPGGSKAAKSGMQNSPLRIRAGEIGSCGDLRGEFLRFGFVGMEQVLRDLAQVPNQANY